MTFLTLFTITTLMMNSLAIAATTENDLRRKNIQIVDAYSDDRGVTVLKVKYQDPEGATPNPSFIVADTFMCYKKNCYQMESSGSVQLKDGKFYNIKNRFVLDETNTRAIWTVNLEDGSEPSLECPTFKKTLTNVSNKEIAKLTTSIHSGQTNLISLPEEASAPKYYYEDADKNLIYIDQTKFKIPPSYRFFEGKAGDLKEVKVKSVFLSIPGNPEITLEDGRKINVGSHYHQIKMGNKTFRAKNVKYIDTASLNVAGADSYKFKLTTPCLETFTSEDDCASDDECKNASLINNSSRGLLKPEGDKSAPRPLKDGSLVIPQ